MKVSQTSRQNVVHQNVIDRKDWHVSYLPAPFTQNVCLFNASNDDDTSTHPPQNDLCQNIFSTLLHHQNVINKRHIICQSCHLALSQRQAFTKWYLTKCHNGKGTFGTLPFDLESSDY